MFFFGCLPVWLGTAVGYYAKSIQYYICSGFQLYVGDLLFLRRAQIPRSCSRVYSRTRERLPRQRERHRAQLNLLISFFDVGAAQHLNVTQSTSRKTEKGGEGERRKGGENERPLNLLRASFPRVNIPGGVRIRPEERGD